MSNPILPHPITQLVNTQIGMVVVIIAAITVFFHTHPVVGILGFLVAYEVIRTASHTSPSTVYSQAQPSFSKKADRMQAMQPPFKKTLEEEMVTNMVPLALPTEATSRPPSYRPVLDNVNNAQAI